MLQMSVRLGTNILQFVSFVFKYSMGCSTLHSESRALFFKPGDRKIVLKLYIFFTTWSWWLRQICWQYCILTECFDSRRIYVRNDVKHPSQRLVSKIIVVVNGGIHWKCRSEGMMSAVGLFIAPIKNFPFPKRSCYLRFGFDCL